MSDTFRLAAVALIALASAPAMAQNASPKRMADGHPDLQGIWTNVSLTTLGAARVMRAW
jgi:hypothetical protein